MNPSTATARAVVDELIRCGVREVVLSPGSRNAPLSLALHAADAAGLLRLHVRIDERTAGFLALGLAKASGVCVPAVTTSGTAAVNLHPAVVEAYWSGVPLLAITANRPDELQDTGANQTIHQMELYGCAIRMGFGMPAPRTLRGDEDLESWRSAVRGAVDVANEGGSFHLDLAFRDPLLPGGEWTEPPEQDAPGGGPLADDGTDEDPEGDYEDPDDGDLAADQPSDEVPEPAGQPPAIRARALVVIGSCPPQLAEQAATWAAAQGLPVIAEPMGRTGSALDGGPLLLEPEGGGPAGDVEQVICVGRPTLSRAVQRVLHRPDVEVLLVDAGIERIDPLRPTIRLAALPDSATAGDPAWLGRWARAAAAARVALDSVLEDTGWPTGPTIARELVAALPAGALLVLGSSAPIRDVDLASRPRDWLRILANRGAAGIDGTVSTAIGAALAHQRDASRPAYALMGDLTFLHDSTGLIIGPEEPRPDLTIVVVNDNGGGIFGLLEQGAPEYVGAFERVFGTPHGVDLAQLCMATGTPHRVTTSAEDFLKALIPDKGIRVVEVRTDRGAARPLHERLRTAVSAAIGGTAGDALSHC